MALPNHFSLLKEHPSSFEIHDKRDNSSFHIAKQHLDASNFAKIKNIQKFDAGGIANGEPISQSDNLQDPAPVQDAPAQPDAAQPAVNTPVAPDVNPDSADANTQLDNRGVPNWTGSYGVAAPNTDTTTPDNSSAPTTTNTAQAAAPVDNSAPRPALNPPVKPAGPVPGSYDDLTSRVSKSMDEMNDPNGSYQQLMQQVLNQKIDPNHYWENKSTGGKIAASIGVLLGGIGAGMLHSTNNVALDNINNAIKNDIDAQAKNSANKMDLLQVMGGDKYKAMNVQLGLASSQLQNMAQKAGIPLQNAQLQLALQDIQQKKLQNTVQQNQLQMMQDIKSKVKSGNAQDVPLSYKVQYGLPQDQVAEGQKQASEYDSYLRTTDNVNKIMDQLDKEQTTGNLVNPQSYQRTNQLKAQLVQAIMETSPSKRLTKESVEQEIKPFEFGTLSSQDTRNKARQGILNIVDAHSGPMNILSDNGFIPKVGSDPTLRMSSSDRAVYQEIKANPQNPKAQAAANILKARYGI